MRLSNCHQTLLLTYSLKEAREWCAALGWYVRHGSWNNDTVIYQSTNKMANINPG